VTRPSSCASYKRLDVNDSDVGVKVRAVKENEHLTQLVKDA
jgi:hypothetical protein